MKAKWVPQNIATIPHKLSKKEYQQMLAELARVLYPLFCQLENQSLAATIEPVPNQERTGTDG